MVGLKVILTALKLCLKVLWFACIYFGMWVPALYLIGTGIYMIVQKVGIDFGMESPWLFYTGLGITLFIALCLTVRSYIIKPIKRAFTERVIKKNEENAKAEK